MRRTVVAMLCLMPTMANCAGSLSYPACSEISVDEIPRPLGNTLDACGESRKPPRDSWWEIDEATDRADGLVEFHGPGPGHALIWAGFRDYDLNEWIRIVGGLQLGPERPRLASIIVDRVGRMDADLQVVWFDRGLVVARVRPCSRVDAVWFFSMYNSCEASEGVLFDGDDATDSALSEYIIRLVEDLLS